MPLIDRLDRRFPRFAFARHVPPRQIAYRLRQKLRRKMMGPALGNRSASARLMAPANLPQPLFAPRTMAAERLPSGWHFRFIGRSHTCADRIDWTAPGPSPADQLWRMNLHYMEYLEVLPFNDGLDAIDQWITAYPVSRPGALSDGWNSYAVSIRILCWLQWLACHGEQLGETAFSGIAASLLDQAAFLEANLELDIGGNHLFKNIKALIAIGAATQGPDGKRWQERGIALLRGELARQILPDGTHFELSPSYHCQVTADLLEIISVLPAEQAREFHPVAAHMVHVAALLSHPDGLSAQFNDAGLHMAYAPGELITAAAALDLTQITDQPQVQLLPSSGYMVWREGQDATLIVKGGPIGADTLPAHAHGDHGSFELSLGGQRFIVDQGVNVYVAGADRLLSRSASGHNVTTIDGLDQGRFFGDFRLGWRTRPSVGQLEADQDHSTFTSRCQHSSSDGAQAAVERRFDMQPGTLLLTDRVKFFQSPIAKTSILFHPDVTVMVEGRSVIVVGQAAKLTITGPEQPKIIDAVWWPDMGISVATQRLVWDIPHQTGTIALSLAWTNESNR